MTDAVDNLKARIGEYNKNATTPLWKGPEEDGITFSLLSKFLVCRERFRLLTIEGIGLPDTFNAKIEFGNMWHLCEETHAKLLNKSGQRTSMNVYWYTALKDYCRDLCRKYPMQQEEIDHWYHICLVQFPAYLKYWAKTKTDDGKVVETLLQEQTFNVPYKLPNGRVVRLRGKFDKVDLAQVDKKLSVWIQENKTKSSVKPSEINRQLGFDLQTMIYRIALDHYGWDDARFTAVAPRKPFPVAGVRYNVIRRDCPIRRHKPSKKNPAGETKEHFYARLKCDYFEAEPEEWFARWNCRISGTDCDKFRSTCLDPVLNQLCDWWDWVAGCKAHNRNPFLDDNHIHWRHPYGVYNVLNEGGISDLDGYMDEGSMSGLGRVTTLFKELEDESGSVGGSVNP